VKRSVASELEFDKVQMIVAARAQSGPGRSLLTADRGLPTVAESEQLAGLTAAVDRLLEDDGRLSFAGVDDALPWLEPGSPLPGEPSDLLLLLTLARRIASVRSRLLSAAEPASPLRELGSTLPDTSELVRHVAPKLGRDGTIPDDASPELSRLRRATTRLRGEVLGRLEEIRRGHADVVTDAPATVRRDRYCLPVRASARGQLQGLLLDTSSSGATAFMEPFAVVELNNELAATISREQDEIRRILAEIAAVFGSVRGELAAAVETLATLDAAQARAQLGRLVSGRVVVPARGAEMVLVGARHPLLDERLHTLRSEVFGDTERRDPSHHAVPLDFRLPGGTRTVVVSGPNAGGKTVTLKTIGLMTLMAAHGIPLPVDDGTVVPAFDRIWCHIGDEQDVSADLSSFSGAMAATRDLLSESGHGSLVLYDELGAGTDPLEGAALGLALLEELTQRGCVTVATTHLASIALNATAVDGMANAAMGYDERRELPTYTLSFGRPGRSRAIEIARRTGIPEPILQRAGELLGGDHLELDRWLRRLEEVEAALDRDRLALDRRRGELERLHDEARRELERLDADRERLAKRADEERDRLRRRAKERLDEALARLDVAVEEAERLGKRRRQKLREAALDLDGGQPQAPDGAASTPAAGDTVRLIGLGGTGIVDDVRGSRALVRSGDKRLWVELGQLELTVPERSTAPRATVRLDADSGPGRELSLLGLDREAARDRLERFLDQAWTAGLASVRVVHGHGTGALRKMVTEVCARHPAVRSFAHPPQNRGGTGATEVELEGGT
jgi:DNA mismatch repair protein MutS2